MRSDDPKNVFFDRFTSGLTASEVARMKAIEPLFKRFQTFADSGPAPGPESLHALAQAVSMARPIACCNMPIRYRPEVWVDDGGGLWRKRRARERYTVAGA
jgi:hypothetical protein